MAEVVERNLEGSLSEILYIKKVKLFTKTEINEIIRKRRLHEYALQKRNKRVLDYDAYITTELTVLKLLRFRRQQTDDRRYFEKIERSIISRLVRLHRQLCYRFQSRIDVWIRFIGFCKILGRHLSVVRIWNRLLQVHGRTDPRLWAAAASYHLHENARAKERTKMRQLSKEASQLTDRQQKLRSELRALTRFVDRRNHSKISTVFCELRESTAQISKAMTELGRERRLVHDRVILNAIREARRLLSEGFTLNPQCKMLPVELAKLEACAADFFTSRVVHRTRGNDVTTIAEKAESECAVASNDASLNGRESGKRGKRVVKSVAEDDVLFLADVTEDISFIMSGKSFRLVVESVLNQWSGDKWVLEQLQQLTSACPHLFDESLRTRLSEAVEKVTTQPLASNSTETQVTVSSRDQMRSVLADRTMQLYKTVETDGIEAALRLWNSWFVSTDGHDANRSLDTFRFVNPDLVEAVGLLRTRLALDSLHVAWSPGSLTTSDFSDNTLHLRRRNEELMQQTRNWLDVLVTSPWGQRCAEFWICYMKHENDCGDCTRVPAVQWRASKTLIPDAYRRFVILLNSSPTSVH